MYETVRKPWKTSARIRHVTALLSITWKKTIGKAFVQEVGVRFAYSHTQNPVIMFTIGGKIMQNTVFRRLCLIIFFFSWNDRTSIYRESSYYLQPATAHSLSLPAPLRFYSTDAWRHVHNVILCILSSENSTNPPPRYRQVLWISSSPGSYGLAIWA
jgi:hypothetical protein